MPRQVVPKPDESGWLRASCRGAGLGHGLDLGEVFVEPVGEEEAHGVELVGVVGSHEDEQAGFLAVSEVDGDGGFDVVEGL